MSRVHVDKQFWLAAWRAQATAFRYAVAAAQPDAPVPSRPQWTISDLIRHLGDGYGSVRSHIARGVTTAPDPWPPPGTIPPGQADLLAWWDEQYMAAVELLSVVDEDLPAWNWAPQRKTAGFWHRRMAHETTIHRWDAQVAIAAAEPIETKLAADAVAEVLDTWLPAGRARSPVSVTGIVALDATDAEHHWYVRLRAGTGVALLDTDTLLDTAQHHERASAHGTASDLALALYGRIDFDLLDIAGDQRLVEALRVG